MFNAENHTLPEVDIIGPYSMWPRKKRRTFRRNATLATTAVGAAAFVHCLVPMMF